MPYSVTRTKLVIPFLPQSKKLSKKERKLLISVSFRCILCTWKRMTVFKKVDEMKVTKNTIEKYVIPALKKFFYGNDMEAQKAYEYLDGFCSVNGADVSTTIEHGRKYFPVISPKTMHKR